MKKWLTGGLMGLGAIAMIAMVISFRPVSQRIQENLELLPGQSEPLPVATDESASLWSEVYDLELTGTDIQPDSVSWAGGELIVLERDRQLVIWVDLATKNFTKLPPAPAGARAVLLADEQVYVYAAGVYRYDQTAANWQAITPNLELPAEVEQMRQFGGNLYLFGQNMIRRIRFDQSGNFADLTDWLAEGQQFEAAPSDAYLDGYIYLGLQGAVQRFLRGEATNWHPAITTAGPLYLSGRAASDQLFVLSPGQATLWVLDSDGQPLAESSDRHLLTAATLGYDEPTDSFFTLINRRIYQLSGLLSPTETTQSNTN